jgi:hypothetical protein
LTALDHRIDLIREAGLRRRDAVEMCAAGLAAAHVRQLPVEVSS